MGTNMVALMFLVMNLIGTCRSDWIQEILIGSDMAIERDNQIATLATVDREYKVLVRFLPNGTPTTWGRVVLFTNGEANTYGFVNPGVFYHGLLRRIAVTAAVSGDKYYEIYATGIDMDVWHTVEVIQEKEGDNYYYSVIVNGANVFSIVNNGTEVFRNVQVYASDQWYRTQSGYIGYLHFYRKPMLVPPPTPEAPVVTVNGDAQFICEFVRDNQNQTIFELQWFGVRKGSFQPYIMRTEEVNNGSKSYISGQSDQHAYIYCTIRYWFVNQSNAKSEVAMSNRYFIGVQFIPETINVYENGPPTEVGVRLTMPCVLCNVTIRVTPPLGIAIYPCYLTLNGSTPFQTLTIFAIRDFADYGVTTNSLPTYINYSPEYQWDSVRVLEITRISVSTGRCTSTGDPHLRTFDGVYYNHYHLGDYILTQSETRRFQVHVRTQPCARVTCNCGIAVREGDDVLSVNMCGRKFSPEVRYNGNREPRRGTFIERSPNGKTFILKFRSTAFVKFTARHWYASNYYADVVVQIPADDYGNTTGLCGRINKDRSDDMMDRSGRIYHASCGHHACTGFTESWKLSRNESLFYYRGGDMECLPSVLDRDGEDRCSLDPYEIKLTRGYKRMVFPGQVECNRRRNSSIDDNIIVLPEVPEEENPEEPDPEPFVPVVPTFPTPSGISENDANLYCRTEIEGSAIYGSCSSVVGNTFLVTGFIEQCVADIQILDNKIVALRSAMDAMKSDCEEVVNRNTTTWKVDGSGNTGPPVEVLHNLCPNDCSGNGNCVQGRCVCSYGYLTEDCSINAGIIPELEDIPCGEPCDARRRDCSMVTLRSQNLIPGNITCGIDIFNISGRNDSFTEMAEFLSFSEVRCELPEPSRVVLHRYRTLDAGISTQTYQVSLSNDGKNFSANATYFIVYDSKCMTCPRSVTCDGPRRCVQKGNTCMVQGYCFGSGEHDPENIGFKVCDPERSTTAFVIREDIECPKCHPYAYSNGSWCCRNNKEAIDPSYGAQCDGNLITFSSSCCLGDAYLRCPHGRCTNYRAPPTISVVTVNGLVKFQCEFSRDEGRPTVYEIKWYGIPRGSTQFSLIETTEIRSGNKSYISGEGNADAYVFCTVRYWLADQSSVKSGIKESTRYFIGVQFVPEAIDVYESGSPTEVQVRLTMPCVRCNVTVELTPPDGIAIYPCYFTLNAARPFWTVSIYAIRDFVDNTVSLIELRPSIQFSEYQWSTLKDLQIRRVSVSTGRCTSTGDPHIRTFDGAYYNHYYLGDYILLESQSRRFQVHVRTQVCTRVTCNCGIVVKEGEDVLSVNMCGRRYSPEVRYRSNREPRRGTFIEKSQNGKTFIMKFRSTAFVKFTARHWFGSNYYADIVVQIPGDDYNNTIGLCGRIDKDKRNDMMDRSGRIYHSSCGHHACTGFTESWKLSRNESLFYYRGERDVECLPVVLDRDDSEDRCSLDPYEVLVTRGYRRMFFPGQEECDKQRNVSREENVIVLPQVTEEDTEEPEAVPFVPVVPTFPTQSGVSEGEANSYCRSTIEASNIYRACRSVIGNSFSIVGFVEQCVADIQILDDKVVALQSAMAAMKSDCEEVVSRNTTTWRNNTDGAAAPPNEVLHNLCPDECSGNGNCSQGRCICNEGFFTEDCSVILGVIPSLLEDNHCDQLCDVREMDCTKVRLLSKNLVPGSTVCRISVQNHSSWVHSFEETAEFLSFSEVRCKLPEPNRRVLAIQTYVVSISNDGRNFSANASYHIVYDSKCMKCSRLCEEPRCVLKNNTCMIEGLCFISGEADPENNVHKVCDPARNTSAFVIREEFLTTRAPAGGDAVKLQCHELGMSATIDTNILRDEITNTTIVGCDPDKYDVDGNTISTRFNECSSTIAEEGGHIKQENVLAVQVRSSDPTETIYRAVVYYYNLQCKFDRRLNVTHAAAVIVGGKEERYHKISTTNFTASMQIYETSSYNSLAPIPLEVTSFQPIHIQIASVHNNRNFKFVTESCYATPSTNPWDSTNYLFFEDKCPIDATFQEHNSITQNKFSFSIDAFRFIMLKKEVYFHCNLLVCKADTVSEECTQTCGNTKRKRKAVAKTGGLERVEVNSGLIRYKNKPTCRDTICPKNTYCVDLYPATCRCIDGFVRQVSTNVCSDTNLLAIKGLHLDIEFISAYSDTSSDDFLRLATNVEDVLMAEYPVDRTIIAGVKVIGARNGSVVLDLLVKYEDAVTPKKAYDAFIKSVIKSESIALKIKRHIVPSLDELEHALNEEISTVTIVSGVLLPLVIILLLLMIILAIRNKRNAEIAGNDKRLLDNTAVSTENITL